jgi:hypothetical protein
MSAPSCDVPNAVAHCVMRCCRGDRAPRRYRAHDSSPCCWVGRSRGRMTGSRMSGSRMSSSRMSSSRMASSRVASSRVASNRCMTGRRRVSGGSCMASYSRVSSSSRVPGSNRVRSKQEVRRQYDGAEGQPQARVRRASLVLLLDTGADVGLERHLALRTARPLGHVEAHH